MRHRVTIAPFAIDWRQQHRPDRTAHHDTAWFLVLFLVGLLLLEAGMYQYFIGF